MRAPTLILVGLLVALDAGAQGQTVSQPGPPPQQRGQVAKFRKSGIRPATLRTRAAARRAGTGVQVSGSSSAEEGAVRMAAAAARKRAPSSSAPAREGSSTLADRLAMQLDLAWTGDY